MAKNEGYFKGEKKKPKKDKERGNGGLPMNSAPTFVMPEVISKKKKNNDW
ncbi:MAG TPA: hypothetical protein VG935_00430 [Patescibacteria group bacterium]|nr:hypothetical protein [Patescibacteria group bacterium]